MVIKNERSFNLDLYHYLNTSRNPMFIQGICSEKENSREEPLEVIFAIG